jgi:hypothetical protein
MTPAPQRTRQTTKVQVAAIAFLSLAAASGASHALAAWIEPSTPAGSQNALGSYRRIGPEQGPQIFCAGSSLLQFGLSWSEISASLGQGIENWGVGGSSPEIWETSQQAVTNTNLMIVGVSIYDLNEYHLSAFRASFVPLPQTVRDLWDSGAEWQFSRRVLSQYPLLYLRRLFPTAGDSDKVLVGVRTKVRERLGLDSAAEDREMALILPKNPILEFGESTARVSDWTSARVRRRVATLAAENGGQHAFDGPKRLALHRMLLRARSRGRVIIVVLPVSQAYVDEFETPDVVNRFEHALAEATALGEDAQVIRLDRVSGLSSHEYFADLVHLNSAGRRIATAAFLKQLPDRSER